MSFKKEHPEYLNYESNDFYVKKLPGNFMSSLEGFIARHCEGANQLKSVINDIASRIPCEMTHNWGWDFLIDDLSRYLRDFESVKFHKIMDFLSDFYDRFQNEIDLEVFNEFLEDLKIGYKLNYDSWAGVSWELKEDVSVRTSGISETSEKVKDICAQTLEHLEQAKEHLSATKTDRDRKDALRDCMSAMESMLKTITGEKDIKEATRKMRDDGTWGPDIIVKDGLSLWNRLHDMYPDVRHGNPEISQLTDEEALYWIERVTIYIKYLSKMYKNKT